MEHIRREGWRVERREIITAVIAIPSSVTVRFLFIYHIQIHRFKHFLSPSLSLFLFILAVFWVFCTPYYISFLWTNFNLILSFIKTILFIYFLVRLNLARSWGVWERFLRSRERSVSQSAIAFFSLMSWRNQLYLT